MARHEMIMYFKPGFHPNHHDTDALLGEVEAKLGFKQFCLLSDVNRSFFFGF